MPARADALPFDLHTLEAFLAVCDTGSMAAAAKALGLTQPAISQTIADLEAKSGMRFFDRSVRPIALTPPGEVMRQRASALISEARQIAPALRETARGRFTLIRAGIVDSLARALSGPIATFLTERAEQVSLRSGLTAAHAEALLSRNLDLFIGTDDLSEIEGLERFELVVEPYVLLLPAGVGALRAPQDLVRLARKLPFVRYSARSKTGIEIERHLRRINIELPPGAEFDTPFGVTDMVARGRGFAISTPLCVAESAVSATSYRVVSLPGPRLQRKLTVVARKHELGKLARDLTETCKTELKKYTLPRLVRQIPWLSGELSS